MPTLRTARMLARGNGKTPQEMLTRLVTIDRYMVKAGMLEAMEKYGESKNNLSLRGEI